jgi:gliding motility-associated-like protein
MTMDLFLARLLAIILPVLLVTTNASAIEAGPTGGKCTGTDMGDRTAGGGPVVELSTINVSCNGAGNGAVNATISGGVEPYSFSWSNGAVTEDITGLGAGTYTLTVTDANGISTSAEATITEPAPLLATITSITDVLCFGGTTGAAAGEATGGTPPYQYLWNSTPNSTAPSISGQSAGTYVFNVTDDNGCATATTATIAQPAGPLDGFIESVGMVSCNGGQDGNVVIGVVGGSGTYSVIWNTTPVQTGIAISGLPAGSYLAEITDLNGCGEPKFLPVTITEPADALDIQLTPLVYGNGYNTSCAESEDGGIDATITGGTQPYAVQWTTPDGSSLFTEDIFNVPAGTYSIAVTDGNGCTADAVIVLLPPPALEAQATITPASCLGIGDGAIDVTVQGGFAPYSLSWSGPDGFASTQEDLTGLAAGTYVLSVTDATGCRAEFPFVVGQPGTFTVTATSATFPGGSEISCPGASDGSLVLSVNGGNAPFTILWTGPDGFTSSATDLAGLAQGTYSVTVTDALGCSAGTSVTLSAPAPLDLQATLSSYPGGTSVSCADASDGSIDLTVAGGVGGYLHAWTGAGAFAATTEDVSGLGAGSYTVQVTDLNGCQEQATYTLSAPQPLDASAIVVNTICLGASTGSIDLTIAGGTGPYTQSWTSGLGLFSSTAEDLQDLFAGVYTVTITDANGCILQRSFNVDGPDLYTIDGQVSQFPGGGNVSCGGASDGAIQVVVAGGAPPYTYTWFTPGGVVGNTTELTGLAPGTYEFIVTDQNGCTGLAVFELTGPEEIEVGLLPAQYPGGSNVSCPDASDGSIDAIVVGGAAPYTFLWTAPDGSTFGGEDPGGLAAGTYTLTITDAAGCEATSSITLLPPAPLTASVNGDGTALACAGDDNATLELVPAGGTAPYTIAWSGPGGFSSNDQAIGDLAAGEYIALVTDLNGCTTPASATISEPAPINITLDASTFGNGSNLPCNGSTEGSISATVAGGTPDLTYAWTGPNGSTADTPTWSDLSAGTYTVTVTDANNCSGTAQITLAEPEPLAPVVVASDAGNGFQVSCLGNDGTLDVTIAGGTAPYTATWTGDDGTTYTTEDVVGLTAGVYSLVVTDANGCTATVESTLTAPEPITLAATTSDVICTGGSEGSITLTISGGAGAPVFVWSGPDGFTSSAQDITGLAAGTYTVVVSDAASCVATTSATITTSGAMVPTATLSGNGGVNIPCAGGTTGTIAINVEGGTAPVTIAWSGPGGFNSDQFNLQGLGAGTYAFTLTDANGCTKDSTITLVEPQVELATVVTAATQPGGTNIACAGGSDGELSATATGGSAPYDFAWTGPEGAAFQGASLQGLGAGTYSLVVTDANGCTSTSVIDLSEPADTLGASASVSVFGNNNTSCASSNDGSIGLQVTGGTPAYSYNWSGPGGFTSLADSIGGLAPGVYTVIITDVNGCSVELSQGLIAPLPIDTDAVIATYDGGASVSCADASDGSIELTVSGGTAPATVSWEGPGGFSATGTTLAALAAGTYCATITDANGCTSTPCFTLTAPEPLTASAIATPASCGNPVGTVDLVTGGGTTPYSIAWSNGATSEDLADLSPGTYTAVVSDANGCSTTASAEVIGTQALSGVLSSEAPQCQGSLTGSITASVSDGQAPYSYVWNNGSDQPGISGLGAGSYTVTVTDANGCGWSGTTTLADPPLLSVESEVSSYAGGFGVSSFGGTNGEVFLTTTGGVAPYSYAWSNGATGSRITGLAAGSYSVIVTDANGCGITLSFILTQPDELMQPTGFTPNGDGANDFYVVRGLEAYPQNSIVVFNRWGNVVFERVNYRNDWAGENMTGEVLPNGTYFVIVTIPSIDVTLQNYVDLRR